MKYVYVIVSNGDYFYVEQAYVSIFSLHYHNPKAEIVIATDKETYENLTRNNKIFKSIQNFIIIKTPDCFTSKQKSRFIKTSLRLKISGDFVYLDVDTIILGELKDLFNIDCHIGAVKDCHGILKYNFQYSYYLELTQNKSVRIKDYYNTGVLIVKDSNKSRLFFYEWHKKWLHEFKKNDYIDDQPSFNIINKRFNIIKNIDDVYNCQVLVPKLSDKIKNKAVILHYFANSNKLKRIYFPLNDNVILEKIKLNGIDSEINRIIMKPIDYLIIKNEKQNRVQLLKAYFFRCYVKINKLLRINKVF